MRVERRIDVLHRSARVRAIREARAAMDAAPDGEIAEMVARQRSAPDNPDLREAWIRAFERWGITAEQAELIASGPGGWDEMFAGVLAPDRRRRINALVEELRKTEEHR